MTRFPKGHVLTDSQRDMVARQTAKALTFFLEALELVPGDPKILIRLGMAYMDQNK